MNPDRLPELLRQRELVRTHLAWLEREIATATATNRGNAAPSQPTGAADAAPSPTPVVAPTGLPPVTEFAARLAAPAADLYEPDPRSAALGAKRGCFAAFALTLLLLVLVLAAVYFIAYRDRPLLFVPRDHPMTEKPTTPPSPTPPRK